MEEFALSLALASFVRAADFALVLAFPFAGRLAWAFAPFVLAALQVSACTLAQVLLASEALGRAGIPLDHRRRSLLYQPPPSTLELQ